MLEWFKPALGADSVAELDYPQVHIPSTGEASPRLCADGVLVS